VEELFEEFIEGACMAMMLRKVFRIVDHILDDFPMEEECKRAHAIAYLEMGIERVLERSGLTNAQAITFLNSHHEKRIERIKEKA
jgi:hypothetical protein